MEKMTQSRDSYNAIESEILLQYTSNSGQQLAADALKNRSELITSETKYTRQMIHVATEMFMANENAI